MSDQNTNREDSLELLDALENGLELSDYPAPVTQTSANTPSA